MKSSKQILGLMLSLIFLLISCAAPINNSSWSGNDRIAGVDFEFEFTTSSDNTYTLVGNSGGIEVDDKGTYSKISENEIVLTSGEFSGSKFVKDGSSLKMYLDNGEFFMRLN